MDFEACEIVNMERYWIWWCWFSNGSTAIEGLSGSSSSGDSDATVSAPAPSGDETDLMLAVSLWNSSGGDVDGDGFGTILDWFDVLASFGDCPVD